MLWAGDRVGMVLEALIPSQLHLCHTQARVTQEESSTDLFHFCSSSVGEQNSPVLLEAGWADLQGLGVGVFCLPIVCRATKPKPNHSFQTEPMAEAPWQTVLNIC